MRKKTLRTRPDVTLALLTLVLVGCSGEGGSAIYTGTLHPTGGTCDPPAQATLQVQNDAVMFTPNVGTLTLRGTLSADGAIRASLSVIGAEKKAYALKFENTRPTVPNAKTIEGRYITPRCTYSITLDKL